jgi:hypothetical protein
MRRRGDIELIRRAIAVIASSSCVLILGVPAVGLDARTLNPETWVARTDGPNAYGDTPPSIAASPDGTEVFVTGTDASDSTADYTTTAYDAFTGSLLWHRRYDGPSGDRDAALAIAVSGDGGAVYVTGESVGMNGDAYATVAYVAATGATLWTKRYHGGAGPDFATAIGTSDDGSAVFVTGTSHVLTPGGVDLPDFATIAYDATDGETLWISRWDGGYADGAAGLAVDPGGTKVFVTGYSSRRNGLTDYATVAYGATSGSKVWTKRYTGLTKYSDDSPRDIAVDPDGRTVFVTGNSGGAGRDVDYATVAYRSSTGKRSWAVRYDGASNRDDFGRSVAVSPHGARVFVTGESRGPTGSVDYATVGYDVSRGSQIWVRGYNGPSGHHDRALSVAASPAGGAVFVTGESEGSTGYDFATIAYDLATGERRWLARYDASGVDRGEALAVSPDGTMVFVCGNSQIVPGASDYDFAYATVSYAA